MAAEREAAANTSGIQTPGPLTMERVAAALSDVVKVTEFVEGTWMTEDYIEVDIWGDEGPEAVHFQKWLKLSPTDWEAALDVSSRALMHLPLASVSIPYGETMVPTLFVTYVIPWRVDLTDEQLAGVRPSRCDGQRTHQELM